MAESNKSRTSDAGRHAGLTRKQSAFAVEYVKDFNGKQAAIRAGYSDGGAEVQASELLRIPKVAAVIADLEHAAEAAALITRERVLREYARLAFFDPRNLYDADGNLKPMTDLDADTAAALTAIEVETKAGSDEVIQVRKYRYDSKRGALDSLARTMKMFDDTMTHKVDESLKEILGMIVGAGKHVLTRVKEDADSD